METNLDTREIETNIINDPPIDTYATLNGYRSSDGALIIKTKVKDERIFVGDVNLD